MTHVNSIRPVRTEKQLAQIKDLFREYRILLDYEWGFKDFEKYLDALPGAYAPPLADLLLGYSCNVDGQKTRNDCNNRPTLENEEEMYYDHEPVGCIAFRPLTNSACEIRRFYVQPTAQKRGLGRQLTEEVLRLAKIAGYSEIKLEAVALPAWEAGVRIYKSMGFVEIQQYNDISPAPDGSIYLGLDLRNID